MQFGSRIKVKTQLTSGLSDLWLAAAAESGYQHFSDICPEFQYVPYFVLDANGTDWEEGAGWMSDFGGGTWGIKRDHILGSSNAGAKLSLSVGDHTVILGPPGFLAQGVMAQVYTSTVQSLTADAWAFVDWSAETKNYVSGMVAGSASDRYLWSAAHGTNKIQQVYFARQMRFHGVIAFNPTSVAAGSYELELVEGISVLADDIKLHLEAPGSTTEVTYVPFDKTVIWADDWMPDEYLLRVMRHGDATGAGLYTPGCFLHAELIR